MTEAPKHTPGPWHTDPDVGHEAVLASDGVMVADCAIFVHPKFGKRSATENSANARLIAAAPDMLAALKKIVFNWDGEPEDMDEAREVISKAQGSRT